MWVIREEREPTKEGIYKVKMSLGSINPFIVQRDSYFTIKGGMRNKFRGERDWDHVTEWWEEFEKKTLKIKLKL